MINRITGLKSRWEIRKNWQLIYPVIGILSSFYMGFKFSAKFLDVSQWLFWLVGFASGLGFLKLCLFCIEKLESKWIVDARWELIRIFIVFAITGSSSVLVGRPFISLLGISRQTLNPILYWFLFLMISLVFYQILLVFWGWILGQFNFFWQFEKKMLRRFGFGRFLDK